MSEPEEKTVNSEADERRNPSDANLYRRAIFGITLDVTVSVGQARLSVSEILDLQAESIVPLNAKLDDPITLKVDGRVIAMGDLVEIEEGGLAIRITEIVKQANRAE